MRGIDLKRIREAADLSQEALAKRLGVTRGAVSHWESEARPISEAMARLIQLTLNLPRRGQKEGM